MIQLIPQPAYVKETGGFCAAPENISYINDSSAGRPESYELMIIRDGVNVIFGDDAGRFYADTTMRHLSRIFGRLPCCEIKDAPAFSYRGFMLDSARHFIPVAELKKMIDTAAELKFNKFHWHLSDDQGFRIELEGFPEITEKSTVRDSDNFGAFLRSDRPHGGYYTKAEIRDIVSYCAERFIDVIPEIDIPGHFSAVLHAHPELSCKGTPVAIKNRQGIYKDLLCAGNPDTMPFLRKVFDEICELFPYELIHIGGDEAPKDNWDRCEKCRALMRKENISSTADLQVFFANELAGYLKTKGKRCIVWNDILKGEGLADGIIVQRWMDIKNITAKAADGGRKVIASNFRPDYLDYPYGQSTLKNVYMHDPAGQKGYTERANANIIGMEVPLWTEFVNTPERLEYLCLPRWFAAAENGWHGSADKNYKLFRKACSEYARYLCERGYHCAPEKDWNMSIPARLKDVLSFYNKMRK